MTADQFQHLAARIRSLDKRVDWLATLGGSAGGRISRSITPDTLRCSLRPLKNKNIAGLVFESQVSAVPPRRLADLKSASQLISSQMHSVTGSGMYIVDNAERPATLWFQTMAVEGPRGFTDGALEDLIDANFTLGDLAFWSLVRIHQGVASVEEATEYFLNGYGEYFAALPSEVQEGYLRPRQA